MIPKGDCHCPGRFSGRVVVLTGASLGIGRATALELAKEGASLLLVARGAEALEAIRDEIVAAGGKAELAQGDVCDPSFPDRLVDLATTRYGRLDVLINNAGGGAALRHVDAVPLAEWERDLDANLSSAFRMCRAAVPIMKQQKYGRIVNISSVAGRSRGHLSGPAYSSAKAGLQGLTRHMAWDLGSHGITVNALAPGLTETERARVKWQERTPDERQSLLDGVALGRFATPWEMARGILFLASDDASYITGATLDVNGGIWMS